jgi:hypothetical protein
MPRITLPRIGGSDQPWITPDGIISFPQPVIARLGWQIGQRIRVDYIRKPLCLFFTLDETGRLGFTLHYLNRTSTGGSGGKICCARLAKTVLRPRLALPIYGLSPIYPDHTVADLVLMLEEPDWSPFDFTMAGCEALPADALGVYEILSHNDKLRIGEGIVQARIREHLKNDHLARAAKTARYVVAADKEESLLIEHVLLSDYEDKKGVLPQFNRVKA